MQLGIGAGLLVSAHSYSRVFSRGRRALLHRVVQTGLVVARGGVGMSPPGASCEKISFSGPPFFFDVWQCAAIPCLHRSAKPPNWAQSLA